MLTTWFVVGAAAVAAYTDVTRRKIPNWLVLALLVCGLAARGLDGVSAIASSALVLTIALVLGIAAFAAHILGGGDVKFIVAACAVLGWPHALAFLIYTLISGGILAVIVALVRGQFRVALANVRFTSLLFASGVRPGVAAPSSGPFPYAIAMLAGASAFALGEIFALNLRIFS